MDRLKVGGKVIIDNSENYPEFNGKTGIFLGGDLVEFDHYMDGHSGNGLGKYGHCWHIDGIVPISRNATLKEFQRLMLNEIKEKFQPTKLDTLDQKIYWKKNGLEVGCQNISKKDALKLADAIYYKWGE